MKEKITDLIVKWSIWAVIFIITITLLIIGGFGDGI